MPLAAIDKEPPAQYGNDPGDCGDPSDANHDECPLFGPLPEVFQRGGDGPVSVEGQDKQVEDGGAGGGVVHRQPHLASHVPELPVACNKEKKYSSLLWNKLKTRALHRIFVRIDPVEGVEPMRGCRSCEEG